MSSLANASGHSQENNNFSPQDVLALIAFFLTCMQVQKQNVQHLRNNVGDLARKVKELQDAKEHIDQQFALLYQQDQEETDEGEENQEGETLEERMDGLENTVGQVRKEFEAEVQNMAKMAKETRGAFRTMLKDAVGWEGTAVETRGEKRKRENFGEKTSEESAKKSKTF